MQRALLTQLHPFYQTAPPDLFPTSISYKQGFRIAQLIELHRPKRILQIGCAHGISSLWLEAAAHYSHQHLIIEIFPENISMTQSL